MKFKIDYREFAIAAHGDQMYGNVAYHHHLQNVEYILSLHGYDSEFWKACAWLHDIIEDTETEAHTLDKLFHSNVTDVVLACTGVGKNRNQRQADILDKLELNPLACVVKVADRIANVVNCTDGATVGNEKSASLLQKYYKEKDAFREVVEPYITTGMTTHLDRVFFDANYKGLIK